MGLINRIGLIESESWAKHMLCLACQSIRSVVRTSTMLTLTSATVRPV